jgi:hypothetical protein
MANTTLTYADFSERFPELTTSSTTLQTWVATALDREAGLCASDFWLTYRDEACLLRTAHRYALAYPQNKITPGTIAPTGALTSEAAESWSRSYSAPSNSRSSTDQQDFGRTSYGLEYLTLRDARPAAYTRLSR